MLHKKFTRIFNIKKLTHCMKPKQANKFKKIQPKNLQNLKTNCQNQATQLI